MTISMLSISFVLAIIGIGCLAMSAWAWFAPLDDHADAIETALEQHHQEVLASRPNLALYMAAYDARITCSPRSPCENALQVPITAEEMRTMYADLQDQFHLNLNR